MRQEKPNASVFFFFFPVFFFYEQLPGPDD